MTARQKLVQAVHSAGFTYSEVANEVKMSRATWYRELQATTDRATARLEESAQSYERMMSQLAEAAEE